MSGYELVFSRGARKEYEALDGSVRSMLNKGLARLRVRPAEIGRTLSGDLAGCRELKFRADGLRVIYRIRDGKFRSWTSSPSGPAIMIARFAMPNDAWATRAKWPPPHI